MPMRKDAVKTCRFCGHAHRRAVVDNPLKCPNCGNAYNKAPSRRLFGKYTKFVQVLIILAMIALIPLVTAAEVVEVGGASVTDGAMFGVCHGKVLDGHYPGTLYICGEKEVVPYCNGDEVPETWCQERPDTADPLADFFGDVIARLRWV